MTNASLANDEAAPLPLEPKPLGLADNPFAPTSGPSTNSIDPLFPTIGGASSTPSIGGLLPVVRRWPTGPNNPWEGWPPATSLLPLSATWSAWPGATPIATFPGPNAAVIKNVRIVSPVGLLQENDRVTVAWDVSGDATKIHRFQVKLNSVSPHLTRPLGPVVATAFRQASRSFGAASYAFQLPAVNLAAIANEERMYLFAEPQVTAFGKDNKTINGLSAKGPVAPLSPRSSTGSPIQLRLGPHVDQVQSLVANSSSPGFQLAGDGFGVALPSSHPTYDAWRAYTPADSTTGLPQRDQGATAWRIIQRQDAHFPIAFARFYNNVGTSTWGVTPPAFPAEHVSLRYDAFPVSLDEDLHVVAHVGFIHGSAASTDPADNNRATLWVRVVVQTPLSLGVGPPLMIPPLPTSTIAVNQEVLRIETSAPIVFEKVIAGGPTPLQLIDIPILLQKNASAYDAALARATAKASNANSATPPQWIFDTNHPTAQGAAAVAANPPLANQQATLGAAGLSAIPNAYISVTLMVQQNSAGANGNEGVGVFGMRLSPAR